METTEQKQKNGEIGTVRARVWILAGIVLVATAGIMFYIGYKFHDSTQRADSSTLHTTQASDVPKWLESEYQKSLIIGGGRKFTFGDAYMIASAYQLIIERIEQVTANQVSLRGTIRCISHYEFNNMPLPLYLKAKIVDTNGEVVSAEQLLGTEEGHTERMTFDLNSVPPIQLTKIKSMTLECRDISTRLLPIVNGKLRVPSSIEFSPR